MSLRLHELDWQNIGYWPWRVKWLVIVSLCLLIALVGYVSVIREQELRFSRIISKELQLKTTFQQKYQRVANLRADRQQDQAMQDVFSQMRQDFSDAVGMTRLLATISQLGIASGLEFRLVKPMLEVEHEFYISLPIHVVALGDYHQFAEFISSILRLPNMITVRDFTIQKLEEGDHQDNLQMELVIETYRYSAIEI